MKLYLIRHGKTKANSEMLCCGHSDLHLTEVGKKELQDLKHLYNDIDKDNVLFYSSGLARTNETIKELFGDVCIIENHNLEELNYGDFEMMPFNELVNSDSYKKWATDEFHNKTPNGESLLDLFDRVVKAIDSIINNNKDNKDIVIVTHGGPVVFIYNYLLKNNELEEVDLDNGRFLEFTYTDKWNVTKR